MEAINNSQSATITPNYFVYWKEFAIFVVLLMAVFFIVSIFLPIQYKSTSSILIIQKNQSGLNAYTEVKSAEFSGKIIKQIILSNSFMEGVMDSNDVAKNYFGTEINPEKRIAKWRDSLDIEQVASTGVLNISFLYPDKGTSRVILSAIIDLLQKNGADYFGNPQIGIKIVNKPYYIDSPALPNTFLNVAIGAIFAIGMLIFCVQVFKERFFYFLVKLFGRK